MSVFIVESIFFSFSDELFIFREYYTANRNSPELKLTDPDESGDDYFAVYFEHEWHRVEILDARMGESVRVS